jgi:phospholipase C
LRVPALIISPFAKRGYVDHTQYDTTSILRFITHRYKLPMLPGVAARDTALKANGSKPMGDLTRTVSFSFR